MKTATRTVNPEAFSARRARAVDLVSLPTNIPGKKCGNCIFFKSDKNGYCSNPQVRMNVNAYWGCSQWSNPQAVPVTSRNQLDEIEQGDMTSDRVKPKIPGIKSKLRNLQHQISRFSQSQIDYLESRLDSGDYTDDERTVAREIVSRFSACGHTPQGKFDKGNTCWKLSGGKGAAEHHQGRAKHHKEKASELKGQHDKLAKQLEKVHKEMDHSKKRAALHGKMAEKHIKEDIAKAEQELAGEKEKHKALEREMHKNPTRENEVAEREQWIKYHEMKDELEKLKSGEKDDDSEEDVKPLPFLAKKKEEKPESKLESKPKRPYDDRSRKERDDQIEEKERGRSKPEGKPKPKHDSRSQSEKDEQLHSKEKEYDDDKKFNRERREKERKERDEKHRSESAGKSESKPESESESKPEPSESSPEPQGKPKDSPRVEMYKNKAEHANKEYKKYSDLAAKYHGDIIKYRGRHGSKFKGSGADHELQNKEYDAREMSSYWRDEHKKYNKLASGDADSEKTKKHSWPGVVGSKFD